MYHGIDRTRFRVTSAARFAKTGVAPLILAVGRLREKKGFPTLIDACAILARTGRVFQCEIVGYGPDAASLQARIDAAGLTGRIVLTGRLAHAEVIARYRAADIFVLPCQVAADGDRDGIPNVLLEAMAAGVPVLTTDVSGIPEAVRDGFNGLVVPPSDPVALARALDRLLDDPALRTRLAQAGELTVANRFDGDRNLESVRALLSQAVAAHERAPFSTRSAHGY